MSTTLPWVNPTSGVALRVESTAVEKDGRIAEGVLMDPATGARFPIRNGIARFVENDSYAASFGEQWNRFRRTQLDRFNGTTITHDRLFQTTKWPADLSGQRVLEVGCGAGRFTQVLLDAGAEVHSVDYSSAVEACWANNGPHPRLSLAQADIYALPFPRGWFDKVLCFGVLQHTPDVERAFFSLVPFLKSGGELAIDVYRRKFAFTRWNSKYLYRWLTRRMPRERLRRLIESYVPAWIPIDNALQRVPVLRRLAPFLVPCWNYTGIFPLTSAQIREWAVLDTFDALSPAFDQPQTMDTVRAWFERAGLSGIAVEIGGTGLVGRGRQR